MIPKVIHYFWFGNKSIPAEDLRNIDTWKKYCPDCELRLWNEHNYEIPDIPYVREAYESKNWAHLSDYARLDVVYKFGGVYFDTDVELLRSIDELFELDAFVGFEDGYHVNTGQGFGAKQGSEAIKAMLDVYKNRHYCTGPSIYDMTPCPIINTEALINVGLIPDNSRQKVLDMEIFPTDYFCPKDMETDKIKITNNTYGIHHFHASWYTPKMKRQQSRCKKIRSIFGIRLGNLIINGIVTAGSIRNMVRTWLKL